MKSSPFLPYLLLIILSLIWGSSFILMKEGLLAMTGVQVAALRISVGGLVFLPFIWSFLKKIKKEDIKYVIVAGVLGNGLPAFCFAIGQQGVDSGITGVLNALTPMFTIIIGYVTGVVLLNTSKITGVIIGLVGAIAIVLGKGEVSADFEFGYFMLIILATICYGANINLIKSKLAHYKPILISALPLFFISIPGTIIFLFSDLSFLSNPAEIQTTRSLIAIIILGLLGNSFSLILFNRLIQLSGPVFSSSVTYLIPVVALVWGIADNELVTPLQLAGMVLILTGVYLINRRMRNTAS